MTFGSNYPAALCVFIQATDPPRDPAEQITVTRAQLRALCIHVAHSMADELDQKLGPDCDDQIPGIDE